MRSYALRLLFFLLASPLVPLQSQTCTRLCLQQVTCPAGQTTSISGTVYTPNGTDPLPNVLVYIPNAAVEAFAPGVSCAVAGQSPSGSPLVGTTTGVDGSFTLTNVPVGTGIPLVIESGRWRRQLVVPSTSACVNTAFSTRMPRNGYEGDIPKIAIVTGKADQVECVLRKVGVDDAEFTNPGGAGRINLYQGDTGPGVSLDLSTPVEKSLMEFQTAAKQYDVIMFPCQGPLSPKSPSEVANFTSFANAGGRIYSSHYSYSYLEGNPTLPPVADWQPLQPPPPDGLATVDTSFPQGETLAEWLQLTGATTTQGQMAISTLRHDLNGVIPPTQSWLRLNDPADANPVMQFVFDAPVGAQNQCGRVLFNEYHVENPPDQVVLPGTVFPNECTATPMSPQEKLLEFMLFELTNDGGQPTISPSSADFGSEPVGFQTASKTFTWTNHSTFAASAAPTTSLDYFVTSSNCEHVPGGGSCSISMAFKPSALGPRPGTLTVDSTGPSLTASLTGTGIPDLILAPAATLPFGSRDVGDPISQTITVANPNPAALPFPPALTTGDYAATSTCGATIAAKSSCAVTVTFTPVTTGDRTGSLTIGNSPAVTLGGNGIDFTITSSPASGSVIAGLSIDTSTVTAPLAGFAHPVSLTCATDAPAATCALAATSITPAQAVTVGAKISTVAEYAVVGYTGFGGFGLIWLVGAASGWALMLRRRSVGGLVKAGLFVVLVALTIMPLSGCSGLLPAKNPSYTPPGTYSVTITATDGFLTHATTYSLKVSAD